MFNTQKDRADYLLSYDCEDHGMSNADLASAALNCHGQIGRLLVPSSYHFFYYKFQCELSPCTITFAHKRGNQKWELQLLHRFHCFQSFFCSLFHGQLRIPVMGLFSNAFLPILTLLIPSLQYHTLLITLPIPPF